MDHRCLLPTEDVLSRNKKNTLTARSETTRTDRRGCLERTLDAMSCTQIESDMRCAILSRTVTNSSTPDGGAARASASAPISSLWMAANDDGTAASSTVMLSTIPMSSSSLRCASVAAASSSFAIPKLTLNARSEPSEPSAPVVAMRSLSLSVNPQELRRGAQDTVIVNKLLASQANLLVRVLFLASNTPKAANPIRNVSVKRRVYAHDGVVIGAPVSLLIASTAAGRPASLVLRSVREHLRPAAERLASCDGRDVGHLMAGFAARCVLKSQLQSIAKLGSVKSVGVRYNAAVGVSACAFFALSDVANHDTANTILRAGPLWLHNTIGCLRSHCTQSMPWRGAHMRAELRTLERGVLAFERALSDVRDETEDAKAQLRFCVARVASAMWPQNATLDEDSHLELCDRIRAGVTDDPCGRRVEWTAPSEAAFVPLSALQPDHLSDDGASSGGTSSAASSFGSASSFGDDAGGHADDDPIDGTELTRSWTLGDRTAFV